MSTPTPLPLEVWSLIFTELEETLVDEWPGWSPERHGELVSIRRQTGRACSLVSRDFLEHGRRLLYAKVDNRDALPTLSDRATHLGENPHLASYVTTLSVAPTAESDFDCLPAVLIYCPNILTFEMLEPSDAVLEAEEEADDDDVEVGLVHAVLSRLYEDTTTTGMLHRLRHLRLHCCPGESYELALAVLSQCTTSLRTLRLYGCIHCPPGYPCDPIDCPQLPPLQFPNLRHLESFTCAPHLTAAIVTAAPSLLSLRWMASGGPDLSFPVIPPHTSITKLCCHTMQYSTSVDEPIPTDASTAALSTFISSFPSLASLEIYLKYQPDPLPSLPPDSPSQTTIDNFFSNLPASLRTIRAASDDPLDLFLNAGPALLLPTTTPLLVHLSLLWPHDERMSHERWVPLANACGQKGIGMGGVLGLVVAEDLMEKGKAYVTQRMMEIVEEERVKRAVRRAEEGGSEGEGGSEDEGESESESGDGSGSGSGSGQDWREDEEEYAGGDEHD